jgi:hypothetical protein
VKTRRVTAATATKLIEQHGMLLVFPSANRPDPPSLWSKLYPGVAMRWDWDDGADDRVVGLWHLRERIARSKTVVYAKWFRGKAMFFSKPVFVALLAALENEAPLLAGLPRPAREILELLEESSPQATKALRAAAGLCGRDLEGEYQRALNVLWSRLLIVGVGEAEEGGFPSLAVGATSLVFEDLWHARRQPDPAATSLLERALRDSRSFTRYFEKVRAGLRASGAGAAQSARRD